MSPAAPDRRVASWAVVVWTSADFQPVASGMVNGWRQTSLRAELTAAISALKFCVVDCGSTMKAFKPRFITGSLAYNTAWQHKQDADLWKQLSDQFRHATPFFGLCIEGTSAHHKTTSGHTP